jgi:hypothetical protein
MASIHRPESGLPVAGRPLSGLRASSEAWPGYTTVAALPQPALQAAAAASGSGGFALIERAEIRRWPGLAFAQDGKFKGGPT